jgi:hypothetical protein
MADQTRLARVRRYCLFVFLATVVAAIVALTVPTSRHAFLRGLGWALVAEDPPTRADIVIVSTDSLGAGILEAAELIKSGFAPRIGLFEHPPAPLQIELARRGLPYVDLQAFAIQLARALGIETIQLIPAVVGTNDEGAVLAHWCESQGIHSILFVSVSDHSRRTRRVLARALRPHAISVAVRWTRFSQFDPDHWWQSREGQRIEIVESQKLLVDFLRHPF